MCLEILTWLCLIIFSRIAPFGKRNYIYLIIFV